MALYICKAGKYNKSSDLNQSLTHDEMFQDFAYNTRKDMVNF